jgi:imidazolonepropionase-like amidohydrolase
MAGGNQEGDSRAVALVGGRLIDGTGKDPLEDSVVILDGPIIQETGRKDEVKIPADAEIIDVCNLTVMPGMIDCHCHISITNWNIQQRLFTPRTVELFQTAEMMERTLHAGFTTIRDAGTLNDVGLGQAVEMGLIEGPRLVAAASLVQTGGHFDMHYPSGAELPFLGGGYGGEVCDGVPEVTKAARKVLRQGFDFIKVATSGGFGYPSSRPVHTEWTLDELKAIVHEASARGKGVMAHAINNQGIRNALVAGVWSVEHGTCLDDETIQMFLDKGTYLVPTLSINEEMYLEPDEGQQDGFAPVCQRTVDELAAVALKSFKRAAEAGLKIAVGSDAITEEMHGKNAGELALLVRHGLTPMEAIVAATKTAAEACRVDNKVGTLEVGKAADLLVVKGDPLSDISVLQDKSKLLLVMKEGRACVDKMADWSLASTSAADSV